MTRRYAWPIAVMADVLVVIVFAAVGRPSKSTTSRHRQPGSGTPPGPSSSVRRWPSPCAPATRTDPLSLRAGVRVWLWTVVIGMVVRASLGRGVALSFIIVALLVLGALFLGWRLALGWQRWRSRVRFLSR